MVNAKKDFKQETDEQQQMNYLFIPASVGVHVKCAGHGPIEVGQRHEHVAVARPDVQTVLAQSRVNGEQHLLVAVHFIAEMSKDANNACMKYETNVIKTGRPYGVLRMNNETG